MELDYADLLNSYPIPLACGCSIKANTLKEIFDKRILGYDIYNLYISLLNMSINDYYSIIDKDIELYFRNFTKEEKDTILDIRSDFEKLTDNEKENVLPISIIFFDKNYVQNIADALSFFTDKKFTPNLEYRAFVSIENDEVEAFIDFNTFNFVKDIILQRNNIRKKQEKKLKFKNKLAKEIYYKIHGSEKEKQDINLIMPNIISAVAAKSQSLNIINIWDLTVFQLYDQFQRLCNNTNFDINSISVGVWGNEENQFDSSIWFKNIFFKK